MRKQWQAPRLKTLSIGDRFEESSGITLEQWRAARELQALAGQEKQVAQKVA